MPTLVDKDTPEAAHTRSGNDGEPYSLVFSDEFNVAGRSFWPGDDPYWTAADLWYWATNDMEWYTPNAVTTADGALLLTMSDVNPGRIPGGGFNGFNYTSGMLQSWNQFCFSSGYIEVALTLPGPSSNTTGYWPGAWTMGNLGRPGYGATTDGTWPYS
jgi:beta-glucanase (GH16 family)